MKKVIMMIALVLAYTTGSQASEWNETSLSEMVSTPVKKSTKKKTTKKTTTKKSTTKSTTTKSTTTKSTTSTAVSDKTTSATTTSATDTVKAPVSANAMNSTGSTITDVLGGLLGGSNSNGSSSAVGSIVNGILNNVIGSATFSKADLCSATWKYSKPGCAFTSENLLAKAGGEIAASKIEQKLGTYYGKFGFSATNTYFKFNENGSFEAKIDGKPWRGTYVFDEKTHAIQLKGLLLNISGFATRTTNGISLLFESKKLLTLVQTLSALSGNSTISAIGTISKNYDGVRVGFEMTK